MKKLLFVLAVLVVSCGQGPFVDSPVELRDGEGCQRYEYLGLSTYLMPEPNYIVNAWISSQEIFDTTYQVHFTIVKFGLPNPDGHEQFADFVRAELEDDSWWQCGQVSSGIEYAGFPTNSFNHQVLAESFTKVGQFCDYPLRQIEYTIEASNGYYYYHTSNFVETNWTGLGPYTYVACN